MIKFLRILSFIVAFPALIFFFYFVLKALDTTGEAGYGPVLTIFIAFIILFVPVSTNRLAWVLEKVKGKKA